MRRCKDKIDGFDDFESEQYRPEDYGLTEENGYTRYILYENSGELFRTQADCRRKTSVAQSALSACLNGKVTHYKNMRFRYVYLKERA